MCGIFGLIAPQIDRERVAKWNDLMWHRGPDDAGIFHTHAPNYQVALCARRLSILDLAGGHQPLSNSDGTIWITYNGEVFNTPQLRAELQALGHQFKTTGDTEVIVHAYEAWGDDMVKRLRGMFVFAIWDSRKERLLIARDRFGIKPLQYAQVGDRFAFSSEIKPILGALPQLPRQVNMDALGQLFRYGFVPTPLTMFAGVCQLPAAHTLVYENGNIAIQPYWQLQFPPKNTTYTASKADSTNRFMAKLRDAVDAWRLSDVPVGSLLSGGIDSSALAALLTEISGEKISTFHVAFEALSHDESARAREVANFIGSDHHEFTFTAQDFDRLPDVVRHLEAPQCSATSIPIYMLYKACRDAGFKVVMTGEGADELLGGYHWFDGDRRMQKFLGMPAFLRQTFAQLPLNVSTAARRVLRQAPQDPIARYLLWQEIADNPTLNQLLTTNHQQPATSNLIQNPKSKIQNLHPLHQFLTLDSHTRMVDFINFEVDRMSMAASIEARPPFLDHELWEWCATQSPDFKLTGEANKLLLRWGVAQEKLLPEAIIQRTKQGLATPHADWWRRERLSPWVEEALAESALKESGYFMPAFVAQLRHEHQQGKANHSRVLTGVLTTQIWHDTVLL